MSLFPAPVPDALSKAFWQAARERRLIVQRCPATGRHQWYPRAHSVHAPGITPEWVEATGRGTVFSFSTIHRGNVRTAPYTCALILLEEDVLMLSRLVDVAEADVRVGMAVEVAFEDFDEAFTLPVFRPARPQ